MQREHSRTRVVRHPEARMRLGIARSTIYAYLDPQSPSYKPNFPKPIRIGSAVGFIEQELDDYLEKLMAAR